MQRKKSSCFDRNPTVTKPPHVTNGQDQQYEGEKAVRASQVKKLKKESNLFCSLIKSTGSTTGLETFSGKISRLTISSLRGTHTVQNICHLKVGIFFFLTGSLHFPDPLPLAFSLFRPIFFPWIGTSCTSFAFSQRAAHRFSLPFRPFKGKVQLFQTVPFSSLGPQPPLRNFFLKNGSDFCTREQTLSPGEQQA